MDLTQALSLGESLLERIRSVTDRCEIAGSIRRKKPIVKDVELVVLTSDYEGMYRALTPAGRFIKPGVPDIIDWPPKPNAKYVRMLLNEGIKLDLFIASRDNWGGIYTMRTGSGVGPTGHAFNGFVPTLFSKWKKVSKGGRMVGGQPMLPDNTILQVKEESDFFDLCRVRWIPPEERIDGAAVKSNAL